MKYFILFILSVWVVRLGHTQNKSFTTFHDYLIAASNPVSLKNTEGSISPGALHVLIAAVLRKQNWDEPIDIQNTKQIVQMAAKQKLQIGLAMTYFILGRHYSYEKEDSLAYYYLVKAEKIFTKNKDTTGMLYCYRQLRLTVWEEIYTDLTKQYFNKLITLSTKSSNPIDKYFYYVSVVSADPYFEKQPSESQLSDAFNKAIEMIDKYPYCESMRRDIYHNYHQGYVNLNKYDKALTVALQTIQHPKIKANYRDYQNLGRAYIRVKKYDDAIVVLEKANKEIKTYAPTNLRRQRNINKLLKTAYYNVGNWEAGVKADEEYDRLNEIIFESDRSLAMFHLKEKYSFTEKEAELKRISLEKQVAESRNKLLKAQYDAEKREATLRNLALENQANESKTKLLQSQIEVQKKERILQMAESQKQLLFGGLLVALGLIGTILFISIKLRKTNTKLLELQQGRDKFYTIIAHDLRSPMNNLNDMGVLLHHLISEGKKQELDKVIQQIERMRQKNQLLLNNLFEWGKSQYFTQGVDEPQQKMDVVPLFQELYQNYFPFAEAKKITLTTELPAHLWLTTAPGGLMMVVRNLLDNALKNTPAEGTITLRIGPPSVANHESSFKPTLIVADTGNGIAPDQLRYLQQVFAGKIKPEVGIHGLGLGMILIHHFVQKQKARLTIESEVGKGTCFKLILEA
ncbi:ATP-binding protein [Runella salmonicolor]|uniref:histidine kinase n=1 Tax=Runella salmonicolor TaxID=2950278 RepID=A0ABT1FVP4_9BACT|nr:ATP-binding protein [Runella salmonicolor]MCP1385781.1 HAMP domain-containing histidine kinase [Runella salmonicolor]